MSEVSIINTALNYIGEAPISARTENNKRARVMDNQYDVTRRALLRSYVWNFAKSRVNYAPDATAPAFGFSYRFLMPPSVLKFVGIYDESEPGYQINYTGARIPFKIEGRYVLTDANPLKGFVINDVTDTSLFDPLFEVALGWALARDTVNNLTNDKGLLDISVKGFDMAIREARLANAVEGSPEHLVSSEWFDARQSYGQRGPFRAGPINW